MHDPLLDSAEPIEPLEPRDARASASYESDAVEDLLANCLALPERERESAIESACATHPHLARDLRERVATLHALGISLTSARGFPEQLGDFRLIERLGGGGMGVVYLAVQTSLQRDVALKLIRPEHLYFDGARARFRREAEAVARLQHPGIVPIYAIGEDQGIPFFAMELVRGSTLAEALRALRTRAPESLSGADLHELVARAAGHRDPWVEGSTFDGTWVEACVRIVRQIADALQHAHERGLVHRDVKPSNIALTADGRALLLDFGLTSVVGGGDMTRTGSALGTLPYMSPEQINGARALDARSDVYSLGVTLYEALTLQVPYRGDDTLAVQRLVLDGRPDPIRPRNRRVDSELETVVLAALDREPGRRYESAAAFARDLGHWLAHRPIEARRPGALSRSRRWLQRHPALGTAIVLGPILVFGAAVALIVRERQHSRELSITLADTQVARDAARQASARATSEAETSKRALDFVVGMFAPKPVLNDATADDRQKITTVSEMFAHGESKVEDQLGGDARASARMFTALARVFDRQGAHEKALELCQRARALWRGEDMGEVGPYVAETLTVTAQVLSNSGRVPEACVCLREALPLWPDGPEWATQREETFGDLGRLDRRHGADDDLVIFAQVALDKELAKPTPDPRALGRARADLGLAYLRKHSANEAATELQAAFDALVTDESPPERDTIVLINNLSQARAQQGRLDEAAALGARALNMARAAYSEKSELVGVMLYNHASLDEDRAALGDAMRGYREAARIFESVVTADHPETLAALSRYADLASHLAHYDDAEEAACALLENRTQREALLRAPDHAAYGRAFATLARCTEGRAKLALISAQDAAAVSDADNEPMHSRRAELDRGTAEHAMELWREAICELRCEDDMTRVEAGARVELSRLCFESGAIAEARTLLEGALDLTRRRGGGVPRSLLEALVQVSRAAGCEPEALSYASRIAE